MTENTNHDVECDMAPALATLIGAAQIEHDKDQQRFKDKMDRFFLMRHLPWWQVENGSIEIVEKLTAVDHFEKALRIEFVRKPFGALNSHYGDKRIHKSAHTLGAETILYQLNNLLGGGTVSWHVSGYSHQDYDVVVFENDFAEVRFGSEEDRNIVEIFIW